MLLARTSLLSSRTPAVTTAQTSAFESTEDFVIKQSAFSVVQRTSSGSLDSQAGEQASFCIVSILSTAAALYGSTNVPFAFW